MTNRLVSLAGKGLLKVSGPDAKKLLQGQLTCDVEEVKHNESRLGAHCTPEGRVVSLFHLFLLQNDYYLLMPRSMVPIELKALKKYASFYKVELSDASAHFSILGYAGSKLSEALLDTAISIPLNTKTPRYLIVGTHHDIESLRNNIENQITLITDEQWKCLNLSDGIPNIYPETSGKLLPHEIDLPKLNAINFNKGCYTGQEIIARMHYRGKLKNHLYLAQISSQSPLQLGADIYTLQNNAKRISGIVVDICHIEYNDYQALIVTDEANAKNNHLFFADDNVFFSIQ